MRRSPRRAARAMAVAAAFVLAGSAAGTAGAAPPASPASPDLGPNVIVFDPSMPVGRDPGDGRRDRRARRSTTRWAPSATRCCSSPAPTARTPSRSDQGRLLHRGRRARRVAGRRRHQRQVEVYNRCLDDGGTSNCLALVNFWRTLSNLTINVNAAGQDGCRASANFWAVSQAASDAPGRRHRRQPVADGLLHRRPAVRERRLHRRLADRLRHQRLAAAVAGPRQRDRRLVQRRVEPGLRRRRGRATDASVPQPAVHDAATRTRSAARSRTCSSTPPAATTSSSRPRSATRAAPPGRAARRPAARSRSASSSSPARRLGRRRSTTSSPAASTCSSPPGCTASDAQHRGQARRHGRPGPGPRHPDRGRRRGAADGRRRPGRRSSPA